MNFADSAQGLGRNLVRHHYAWVPSGWEARDAQRTAVPTVSAVRLRARRKAGRSGSPDGPDPLR